MWKWKNFPEFSWIYSNLLEFAFYEKHLTHGPTHRLMDRWTNGRTDRRMDRRTDGRTDKASYRDAWMHLKIHCLQLSISAIFEKRDGQTDRRTDGPTHRLTHGRTKPLIEMRGPTLLTCDHNNSAFMESILENNTPGVSSGFSKLQSETNHNFQALFVSQLCSFLSALTAQLGFKRLDFEHKYPFFQSFPNRIYSNIKCMTPRSSKNLPNIVAMLSLFPDLSQLRGVDNK